MDFSQHQENMKRIKELQSDGGPTLGPGTPLEKIATNAHIHIDEVVEAIYQKIDKLSMYDIATLACLLFGKKFEYSGTLGNRHDVCYLIKSLTPEQIKLIPFHEWFKD
jgi:hypothetical protein